MPDITMCSYLGCPLRDKCERATATPSMYQSYITNPSRIVHGKFECDMFCGGAADLLFTQLTGIMKYGNKKAKPDNKDSKLVKRIRNARKNRND